MKEEVFVIIKKPDEKGIRKNVEENIIVMMMIK